MAYCYILNRANYHVNVDENIDIIKRYVYTHIHAYTLECTK